MSWNFASRATGKRWLAALSLAIAGCSLLLPGTPEQDVRFPGRGIELSGTLFLPASKAKTGRRPAIVLLHGCGGLRDSRGRLAARHRDWAERFTAWGLVVLAPDSFGPRGISRLCELKDRPIQPWGERSNDAYDALRYLVARADVDPTRVFVLGWSHGSSTVMGAMRSDAVGRRHAEPAFRAGIAFYPGCTQPLRQPNYETSAPLLILHGANDDWAPVAPCVELARRSIGAHWPIQTTVYPGAHHGFDQPGGQVSFMPNAYNPSAPGGRGAHVGRNASARLESIEAVREFLRAHGAAV